MAPPFPRRLERDDRDPFDFEAGVRESVHRRLPGEIQPARLAEVQAAGQFTDDEQVCSGQPLRFDGADRFEPGPDACGPKVRVRAEFAAQPEQRALGPRLRRPIVERRIAHRAKQNGVAVQARLERGDRQWLVVASDAFAANGVGVQIQVQPGAPGDFLQNGCGGVNDLGPDAVAGQQDDAGPDVRHRVRSRRRRGGAVRLPRARPRCVHAIRPRWRAGWRR